jgi:hypothetical protein
LRTVCAIVEQRNNTGRTARKHRSRLELLAAAAALEPRRRKHKVSGQTYIAALPKRATAHLAVGRELLKAAKGYDAGQGRGRR